MELVILLMRFIHYGCSNLIHVLKQAGYACSCAESIGAQIKLHDCFNVSLSVSGHRYDLCGNVECIIPISEIQYSYRGRMGGRRNIASAGNQLQMQISVVL